MTPRLSVVIITRDEEHNLSDCLNSVAVLEPEIVVVDSGSRDSTLAIARAAGARVCEREFKDFASQKQTAVDLSSAAWVLSIDADERVTPALAKEIGRVIAGAEEGFVGYEIPFAVHFMGRRLKFGGLGREKHLRLFRRSAGGFTGAHLHEGIRVTGPVGLLAGRMIHIPYQDLDEYLHKMRIYTSRASHKRYQDGKRFHIWHHLLPFWEFFSRAILKLGVLDGHPGIVWAGLSAMHTWVKYVKLREISARQKDAS